LDFSALCFVNPHRIFLRAMRWGNISLWHQILDVGIEENYLSIEDSYVLVCEIGAYSGLSFIDRGFSLRNFYNYYTYGIKHSCIDVVSYGNREVECSWYVGFSNFPSSN
jgi:hypothetical protein